MADENKEGEAIAVSSSTVEAYDSKTRQRVDVPVQIAEAMWRSGAIEFRKGQEVPIATADGEIGTVRAEDLATSVTDYGAQIVGDQDFKQARAESSFSSIVGDTGDGFGSGAAALAQGLARQVPIIGASADKLTPILYGAYKQATGQKGYDAAEQEMTDALRLLREKRPGFSMAGEVAGTLVGGKLMGTGGLEGQLDSSLKNLATGAGGRIMAGGVAAGVGSLPFMTQQALSEIALSQEPEKAAEKAFANFGAGILAGVLTGGALSGMGEGWRALRGVGGKVGEKEVGKVLTKAAGGEALEKGGLAEKYVQLTSAITGESDDLIRRAGPQNLSREAKAIRRELLDREAARETTARSMRESLDDVFKATSATTDELKGQFKLEQVRKMVTADERAAMQAHGWSRKLVNDIDELIEDVEGRYGTNTSVLEKTSKYLKKEQGLVDEALRNGDVGEAYWRVDRMKREVGWLNRTLQRASKSPVADSGVREGTEALFQKTRSLYEEVRVGLEDSSVWGKIGEAQKTINDRWTQMIPLYRELEQTLGRRVEIAGTYGEKLTVADPSKIVPWIARAGKQESELVTSRMKDAIARTKELVTSIEKSGYELSPEASKQVKALNEAVEKFGKDFAGNERRLKDLAQFDALSQASKSNAGVIGGMLGGGFALGGPGGGALGGLLGVASQAVTDPARSMLRLAQVERLMERADSRMGKAVVGFIKKLTGEGAETATKKEASTLAGASSFPEKAKSIAQAASLPPEELARAMTNATHGAGEVGPRFSDALISTATRGVYFLSEKLPQPPPKEPMDFAKNRGWQANTQQIATWMRYYKAVQDPLSVVEDFKNGRLSPEGVEVLEKVFPKLYEDIRTRVTQEVMNNPREYSRQEKIGLSLLLGQNLDSGLDPKRIQRSQAVYAAAKEAAANPKPRPSGRSNNLASKQLETKTQTLEGGTTK